MANLLQTKIELPPLPRQQIYRERVLQQADASPEARLLLISAPAGFGKSTSLLYWAHRQQEDGAAVAWYAVDERDNDPARFAPYLLAACRTAGIELPLPEGDAPVEIHEAVTAVLNAAAELDRQLLLLLDDYHLISAPAIHDAVRRICDYMPANMRLALATRLDPPLPLARMRARGEMAEIRMADLRFNSAELREWCTRSLGWTPSGSSLQALEQATEGWAAALALIMMNRSGTDATGLEAQLDRYSKSQRHIFDYFAQEVLEQQPEEVRHFLLSTAVLSRLVPELVTVLADSRRAPLLLDRLAAESLFVIPLSDTQAVYRYHHLFARFLRHHLELKDPARFRAQHRRAAQWYAAHDSPVEAVEHALAAADFDYAAGLIEADAYAPLMAGGEFMTLVNWLPRFPTAALARHPRLWLYFVRALYLSGRIEMAETHMRLSEDALAQEGQDRAARQALQAIASNYRATLAAYRGELREAWRWIEQAHALGEWVDEHDRVRMANTRAFIHYLLGDVPAARQAYGETLAMAEESGAQWVILDVHYYLAELDLLTCDLDAAQARCQRLLDSYPATVAPLTPLMLPLAECHYQRDQPLAAEQLLRAALARAEQASQPDTCLFAHLALSALLTAQGKIAEAEDGIAQARDAAAGYRSPMIEGLIAAAEARMWLQSGRLDEAGAWKERFERADARGYQQDAEKILAARIWLAEGEHGRALALAAEVVESARASGRALHLLKAELVRALAHQVAGAMADALSALERALALAQPAQIVRLFLDMGRPLRLLLRQAVARDPGALYAASLLERAESGGAAPHPADLLTDRELEVLAQVATGASNHEIARTLVISVGTVKSHIHRIMNKLNVKNRTEAVVKARTLNILAK